MTPEREKEFLEKLLIYLNTKESSVKESRIPMILLGLDILNDKSQIINLALQKGWIEVQERSNVQKFFTLGLEHEPDKVNYIKLTKKGEKYFRRRLKKREPKPKLRDLPPNRRNQIIGIVISVLIGVAGWILKAKGII